MNPGCLTMIPRPNGKVRNGTRKVLLVRSKHAWAHPRWKPWLLFFLTAVALCTKNLYLQDRQLITPSTKISWNDFQKRVQRVRRDFADDWVLQHDNAPAHTALSIRVFLVKKNIPVLPHPPYSTDLALCDLYLFPKLKSKLKGHHFGTMENIQKLVTDELNTLMENDFQYCCDQWKRRNQCVTSQGSYFEGDNL